MLTPEQVTEIYSQHITKLFFPQLVAYMSSGPLLVMQLARERAVAYLKELIGPTNPSRAKVTHPNWLARCAVHPASCLLPVLSCLHLQLQTTLSECKSLPGRHLEFVKSHFMPKVLLVPQYLSHSQIWRRYLKPRPSYLRRRRRAGPPKCRENIFQANIM